MDEATKKLLEEADRYADTRYMNVPDPRVRLLDAVEEFNLHTHGDIIVRERRFRVLKAKEAVCDAVIMRRTNHVDAAWSPEVSAAVDALHALEKANG